VRAIVFFRNYRKFTGGHLKVRHYFEHVYHSGMYTPRVWLSPSSVSDGANPWARGKPNDGPSRATSQAFSKMSPGGLFLGGRDWHFLDRTVRARSPIPVLNLIQHVRHAVPADPRYQFLNHRAVRICVSPEIQSAIGETRRVNGPVFVVPNGTELGGIPPRRGRQSGILIAALKQPRLGLDLKTEIEKQHAVKITLLDQLVPRDLFLEHLATAAITVFLPSATEGFYLPALEGMATGTLVICPDCVGNRSFCLPGYNSFRPAYKMDALVGAVAGAMELTGSARASMIAAASRTTATHCLDAERTRFLEILGHLDELW
jgi:hypothetical protein